MKKIQSTQLFAGALLAASLTLPAAAATAHAGVSQPTAEAYAPAPAAPAGTDPIIGLAAARDGRDAGGSNAGTLRSEPRERLAGMDEMGREQPQQPAEPEKGTHGGMGHDMGEMGSGMKGGPGHEMGPGKHPGGEETGAQHKQEMGEHMEKMHQKMQQMHEGSAAESEKGTAPEGGEMKHGEHDE